MNYAKKNAIVALTLGVFSSLFYADGETLHWPMTSSKAIRGDVEPPIAVTVANHPTGAPTYLATRGVDAAIQATSQFTAILTGNNVTGCTAAA
jgi:hypothetical protein